MYFYILPDMDNSYLEMKPFKMGTSLPFKGQIFQILLRVLSIMIQTCFLMACTLQLSWCSWLHFWDGRGYFALFFKGGVGMSLGYAFMRWICTVLLQKTGNGFHNVLTRCRESCKKKICSVSWQKAAQVWKELQILKKAAHKQNKLCPSFSTTHLDSPGLRISSVHALSSPIWLGNSWM